MWILIYLNKVFPDLTILQIEPRKLPTHEKLTARPLERRKGKGRGWEQKQGKEGKKESKDTGKERKSRERVLFYQN